MHGIRNTITDPNLDLSSLSKPKGPVAGQVWDGTEWSSKVRPSITVIREGRRGVEHYIDISPGQEETGDILVQVR